MSERGSRWSTTRCCARGRELAARAEYVDLATHPGYQAAFMAALAFPVPAPSERRQSMNLLDLCAAGRVIGDGAMGTELQRAGLAIGECGDRWNLEQPGRILAIHEAYIAAGSQAIITNSFGANRWVLGRYGLADRVVAVNRAAAIAARRAAGESVCVLGDIGPCGGFIRPLGDVDPGELEAEFTAQAGALLEGGADGIIIETMSALDELRIAIRAARAAKRAVRRRLDGVRPRPERQPPDDDGRVAGAGGRRPPSTRAPTSSGRTAGRT